MTGKQLTDPKEIAAAGRAIYAEKYKDHYEEAYPDQFVAINLRTERAYVAHHPEDALCQAKDDDPEGLFHLIKIGSTGAFKVSYTSLTPAGLSFGVVSDD